MLLTTRRVLAASIAVGVLGFVAYEMGAGQPRLAEHPRGAHQPQPARSAVLVGATGATGKQLLAQLLEDDGFTSVVAVGRRAPPGVEHPKLSTVIVADLTDADALREAWPVPADLDDEEATVTRVMFNCIGTTRGQAGGAAGFQKVEVGITTAVSAVAAERGIGHISVVSAQGANPNTWVDSNELIHPLLYARTLGRKEEATLAAKGSVVRRSIFRPGMLNRMTGDRMAENVINALGVGLRVDTLATAMLRDAQRAPPGAQRGGGQEDPVIFAGNPLIKQVSKL